VAGAGIVGAVSVAPGLPKGEAEEAAGAGAAAGAPKGELDVAGAATGAPKGDEEPVAGWVTTGAPNGEDVEIGEPNGEEEDTAEAGEAAVSTPVSCPSSSFISCPNFPISFI